jgi:hypothetical protein
MKCVRFELFLFALFYSTSKPVTFRHDHHLRDVKLYLWQILTIFRSCHVKFVKYDVQRRLGRQRSFCGPKSQTNVSEIFWHLIEHFSKTPDHLANVRLALWFHTFTPSPSRYNLGKITSKGLVRNQRVIYHGAYMWFECRMVSPMYWPTFYRLISILLTSNACLRISPPCTAVGSA